MLSEFEYEIQICRDCELGFQRHIPSDDLLSELYDSWIPESERDRLHKGYAYADYEYLAHQVHFLLRTINLPPHQVRVLDFGLGWAEWARMARAFGCDVYGAEISQARIDNAKRIGIEILNWDEISTHRFHFINTEQVFEHLVSPRETLIRLSDAILPGGIIKFSVPDARTTLACLKRGSTFTSLSDYQRMTVHPLEHINSFTHASIARLGRTVGLRSITPNPLKLLNSSTGWLSPRCASRQLARAIYRHWYPKSTFVYLMKPPSGSAPSAAIG